NFIRVIPTVSSADEEHVICRTQPYTRRNFQDFAWIAPPAHERTNTFTRGPAKRHNKIGGQKNVKKNPDCSHLSLTRARGNWCSHTPVGRFSATCSPGGALAATSRLCRGWGCADRNASKDDCGKRKRHHGSRSQPAQWNQLRHARPPASPFRHRRQLLFSYSGF